MLRFFSFCIVFMAFSYGASSQYLVEGTVKDTLNNPLPFSTVQLLNKSNKILGYKVCDAQGAYKIQVDSIGIYILKASFLGYKAQKNSVVIKEKITIKDIELVQDQNTLDEVELNYEPGLFIKKEDTIIYNLDKIVNGQESNLGDILEKLPGVEVNDQGKISVNGNPIKNLLIDGEPYFDNQHQLATQNISSEMVGGVTFFNKYKGFKNLEGFANDQGTALDISIKDQYRNRVVGNIEGHYGILDKYWGHTNLFQLGKKLKLTMIGDSNNADVESISFFDYYLLDKTIRKSSSGNTTSLDYNSLPAFLQESTKIINRDINFGALNFVYRPGEKVRFNGYSILNTTAQKQFFSNNRFFFIEGLQNQKETQDILGAFFFSTTHLTMDYKPNPRAALSYEASFNANRDEEEFALVNDFNNRQNLIDQLEENTRLKFGQQLSFTKKMFEKTKFNFDLFTEFKNNKKELDLFSNQTLLGFDSQTLDDGILQTIDSKENTYGYTVEVDTKFNKNGLKIGVGSTFLNAVYNSKLVRPQIDNFENNINSNLQDHFVSLDYNSPTIWRFIELRLGLSYHYLDYTLEADKKDERIALFPNLNVKFQLSRKWDLNLNYYYQNQYTDANSTINNNRIVDYLNIDTANAIGFDTLLPEEKYSASLTRIGDGINNSLRLALSYTNKDLFVTTDTSFQPENYANNTLRFGTTNTYLNATMHYRIGFNKNRLEFSSFTSFIKMERSKFVNSAPNLYSSDSFSEQIGLTSRYKTMFNFKAGIKVFFNKSANSINDISFRSSKIDPSLELKMNFLKEKLQVDVEGQYTFYKSNSLSRSIFLLNPSLRYAKPKSHWEFKITGNNVFNLDSPELVQNINNNVYFEERISKTLEGYLLFGANYKF